MSDGRAHEPRSAGAERRQEELLALVRRDGRLDVGPTAARLGVTQETLRRDLRTLEAAGLVRRSYGAAFPVEAGRFETTFEARRSSNSAEKSRIARAAAAQLGRAQTVYLDEGFLPLLVGRMLPADRSLTVVTSSLPAARELAEKDGIEVIIVGGRVRPATYATVDHGHDSMLHRLAIDLAYMGANGIDPERGLTTPHPVVATVKQAAMAAAKRRIFVGSHTKFGASSFVRFANVGDFEMLITGEELPSRHTIAFAHLGPKLVRV